jgi:hypothetical protein
MRASRGAMSVYVRVGATRQRCCSALVTTREVPFRADERRDPSGDWDVLCNGRLRTGTAPGLPLTQAGSVRVARILEHALCARSPGLGWGAGPKF